MYPLLESGDLGGFGVGVHAVKAMYKYVWEWSYCTCSFLVYWYTYSQSTSHIRSPLGIKEKTCPVHFFLYFFCRKIFFFIDSACTFLAFCILCNRCWGGTRTPWWRCWRLSCTIPSSTGDSLTINPRNVATKCLRWKSQETSARDSSCFTQMLSSCFTQMVLLCTVCREKIHTFTAICKLKKKDFFVFIFIA